VRATRPPSASPARWQCLRSSSSPPAAATRRCRRSSRTPRPHRGREQKKADAADLKARGLGPAPPIDPGIDALIQVVRISDYDFIVRTGKRASKGKGKDETRYNGSTSPGCSRARPAGSAAA
jgi:hypothetical protein